MCCSGPASETGWETVLTISVTRWCGNAARAAGRSTDAAPRRASHTCRRRRRRRPRSSRHSADPEPLTDGLPGRPQPVRHGFVHDPTSRLVVRPVEAAPASSRAPVVSMNRGATTCRRLIRGRRWCREWRRRCDVVQLDAVVERHVHFAVADVTPGSASARESTSRRTGGCARRTAGDRDPSTA